MMTSLNSSPKPGRGLLLVCADDPLGNGQATSQVVYVDDQGVTHSSGLFISVHGGGPLNLRAVVGNANIEGGGIFEADPATHRISVVQAG